MKPKKILLTLAACAAAGAFAAAPVYAADLPAKKNAATMISAGDYASIQEAIDRHPGKMIFVPAGDHVIEKAVQITTANGGLWGPGRIVQANPEEAIVQVRKAPRAQIRDVTLTRPDGKQDAKDSALFITDSDEAVVANVQIIDNWSKRANLRVEKSSRVVVRDSLIENFLAVTIEDWTKPATNSGVCSGFAYICSDGTAMNFDQVNGALIQGNRIIEKRLLPTKESRDKYGFGKFTKKNETKGSHIDQKSWDTEYWYGWRQGAGIHIGTGKTSDTIQIIGNYLENMPQGIDIHGDHAMVANNIINDASRGIKAMHGSRNVQIVNNQFNRCDHFAIGLMQGAASHEAGMLPNKGPSIIGANIDGHSIIAGNIISDFGYGMEGWVWQSDGRSGNPIQIGGKSPLADTPPLRNVLVKDNVIYNPGQDKILVDGKLRVEPPRYQYAVRVVAGLPSDNPGGQGGYSHSPRTIRFSGNLFDPGTEGISNVDLEKLSQ